MTALVKDHRLPIQRACRAPSGSRERPTTDLCRTTRRVMRWVLAGLNAVLEQEPRAGFPICHSRIRRADHGWNHKRVRRVYRQMKLNLPRRVKRRFYRPRQPFVAPTDFNRVWALDCMSDVLYDGRKCRILNVIDEANREALTIEVATSMQTRRVLAALDALIQLHGAPEALRSRNGPEFTSCVFIAWCEDRGIALRYIQPGKPDQNAFIERFNRTFRARVLDAYVFASTDEIRQAANAWLDDYNHERPHQSLGGVPPLSYLPRAKLPRESTFQLST